MKVTLIHQAFASPNEAGGTRHFELGRFLVSHGHEFRIVASNLSYLTGKAQATVGQAECYEGVQVERAQTMAALHKSFFWRVVSFVSFMFSSLKVAMGGPRPDVMMGTTPPIFQAVSAWIVSALRRTPLLLEVRDLWPAFAIDMGVLKNPALIKLSYILENVLYARADHLLVNSPAYRDYLVGKGVALKKITLIPNGVDCDMFSPEDRGEAIREQLGVGSKFLALYAGALSPANDIPTILKAAQRVDPSAIHFVLVGDGKDRPELERITAQMALTNVTFVGAVPKSKMPQYLAGADAGVATLLNIPMFKTTYPNKVFDYMAAGRPTILAIDGVIREVIENAEGGVFVPPSDDEKLARAISELNADRPRARAMGESARRYVEAHFNRKTQAKDFLSLLESLARR